MKNKIVFILGALLFVNVVYSEYQYCPVSNKDSGYAFNRKTAEIWSGSWEDLKSISALVRDKFSFELTKHLGRDIAELKPVSRREMKKQISNGNSQGWSSYIFDSYHEPSDVDDMLMDVLGYYMSKDVSIGTQEEKRVRAMIKFGSEINKALKFLKGKVEKFTNPNGGEVVYDKETGKIILNEKIGTKNFGESYEWIGVTLQKYLKTQDWFKYTPQGQALKLEAAIMREVGKYIAPKHFPLDVEPHEKNNQYKYAGILFESDSDGRFYIVDGQTGKRMTKKQVEDFPTTFSDMWKNKGLVCVESDAIDIVPPKENRQSAQNASSEVGAGAVKGNVAKTDADEAKDSNDKGKTPESVTLDTKDDGVDLPILDIRIQEVIKAITILSSCMKEHNAAIDLVLRSQPKRAMNDVKGIIADGHAVSAERKKYEKRIKECILSLNVSFLEMEKEFEDDSVGKLGETRRNTYNTVKPHIIKLFEILRDSPDVIRHIVEQVIPIQFARFLVNNDSKIRNKYLLKSTFGVDFGSYLK